MDTGSRKGVELKKQIETLFLNQLTASARTLLEDSGIDMTNSFYQLGRYDGKKYEQYRNDSQGYLDHLEIQFEVDVILLNERG